MGARLQTSPSVGLGPATADAATRFSLNPITVMNQAGRSRPLAMTRTYSAGAVPGTVAKHAQRLRAGQIGITVTQIQNVGRVERRRVHNVLKTGLIQHAVPAVQSQADDAEHRDQ
jgi:hypothetical protein